LCGSKLVRPVLMAPMVRLVLMDLQDQRATLDLLGPKVFQVQWGLLVILDLKVQLVRLAIQV
jgi:hypothetical protein